MKGRKKSTRFRVPSPVIVVGSWLPHVRYDGGCGGGRTVVYSCNTSRKEAKKVTMFCGWTLVTRCEAAPGNIVVVKGLFNNK